MGRSITQFNQVMAASTQAATAEATLKTSTGSVASGIGTMTQPGISAAMTGFQSSLQSLMQKATQQMMSGLTAGAGAMSGFGAISSPFKMLGMATTGGTSKIGEQQMTSAGLNFTKDL